jgi:hypothetical protein
LLFAPIAPTQARPSGHCCVKPHGCAWFAIVPLENRSESENMKILDKCFICKLKKSVISNLISACKCQ